MNSLCVFLAKCLVFTIFTYTLLSSTSAPCSTLLYRLIHGQVSVWCVVLSLLGQQQQFHAFAFGQRPFLSGHFGSPLDPLQRTDPLSGSLGFRMPAMSNCQSKYWRTCLTLKYRTKHIWCIMNGRLRKITKFLQREIIPYPTAFPYGNGMVLHFYQQQESSTTKTVHKVINKGLKTYV